jgi:hypothetical protein
VLNKDAAAGLIRPDPIPCPPHRTCRPAKLQLRQRLKAERQHIIADFRDDGKPEKLLRGLRHSVDGVLSDAWRAAGCRPARPWSGSAATAAASCSPIPTSTC